MEERRTLLAKALMDLSKIILAGTVIQAFVKPASYSLGSFLVIFSATIVLGYIAWLVMPKVKEV